MAKSIPEENFKSFLADKGLFPPDVMADGQIHRCNANGKRDNSGWYVLFIEPVVAGACGDWRTGEKFRWSSVSERAMSPSERQEYKKRIEEAEQKQREAQGLEQAKAAKKAQAIWGKAGPASPDHPYLKKKGIGPVGDIRQCGKALVVPVRSLDEQIHSLQYIYSDGTKRFLRGGKVQGHCAWIKGKEKILICEGWATAVSLYMATEHTVFCAFNAGNLGEVTEQLRTKVKDRQIVICADNDRFTLNPAGSPHNVGCETAFSIAWKLNKRVAVPELRGETGTDFNDLHAEQGLEAVKNQVDAAMLPADWLLVECETRPGAPFRKDNLKHLRELKARDMAGWMDLRARLKTKKVGITKLEEEMEGKSSAEGGDPSHLELARRVLATYGPENLLFANSHFWQWSARGVWDRLEDRGLKARIHNATEGMPEVTKSIVDSILDMGKTEAFVHGHEWNRDQEAVNCVNGELHWNAKNWELKPHDRQHYRTTQIPIEYNPKATAPRFEKFLREIFLGEHDAEEKAILILEAIGYTLLSTCRYEKFFLLIGPGANGKSVLMETVSALVGRKNCCAVQPSQFENKFQRAHLHGRLANMVTEITEGAEIHDGELKAIVSGELTTAEHKHRDPFEFTPCATCWFGTNHMPRTRDFSSAFFRRAVPIPFNRIFSEAEQDRHLAEKLKGELPGILNLALEGMAGVFTREMFTEAPSSQKAKEEWWLNVDQVRQFVEEKCCLDPTAKTPVKIMYAAYLEWAKEAGVKKTVGRNTFGDRICKMGATRDRDTTGDARVFAGVVLRGA